MKVFAVVVSTTDAVRMYGMYQAEMQYTVQQAKSEKDASNRAIEEGYAKKINIDHDKKTHFDPAKPGEDSRRERVDKDAFTLDLARHGKSLQNEFDDIWGVPFTGNRQRKKGLEGFLEDAELNEKGIKDG